MNDHVLLVLLDVPNMRLDGPRIDLPNNVPGSSLASQGHTGHT